MAPTSTSPPSFLIAPLRRTWPAAGKLDQCWRGFWGVHYIYGTWFGVTGLLAAGVSQEDPATLRACRWLVAARLPDGGWGESWRGCLENRSIPHKKSQVIMTSWALITLMKAKYRGPGAREAIQGGIQLLKGRLLANGDWPKEGVAGVFFSTSMLHYCLYKNYFPVWALGLYQKEFSANGVARIEKEERRENSALPAQDQGVRGGAQDLMNAG